MGIRLQRSIVTASVQLILSVALIAPGCTRSGPTTVVRAVAPPRTSTAEPVTPVSAVGDEEASTELTARGEEDGQQSGSDDSQLFQLRIDTVATANLELQGCPYRDLGVPRPVALEGCETAYCITAPGDLSICRCNALTNGGDEQWIRVSQGSRVIAQWDTWNDMLDASSLVAVAIDLDGDGREELVVSGREHFLCGPGAEGWNVAIVEMDAPGQRPLRFHAWDFEADAFVRSPDDGRCAILATDLFFAGWMDYRLYARPFFYLREGYLAPAASLPLVVVPFDRVVEELDDLDGGAPQGPQGPRVWFAGPEAQVLATDPGLLGAVRGAQEVVIGAASDRTPSQFGTSALLFRLDSDDGQHMPYAYLEISEDDSDVPSLYQLGHAVTGRLFPPGYFPASGASYFTGRQARLEARQTEGGTSPVLWLEPTSHSSR